MLIIVGILTFMSMINFEKSFITPGPGNFSAQPQSETSFCFIRGQKVSSFNPLFANIFTFYILYIEDLT